MKWLKHFHLWLVSPCFKYWVCEECGKKKVRDVEKEIQEIYR